MRSLYASSSRQSASSRNTCRSSACSPPLCQWLLSVWASCSGSITASCRSITRSISIRRQILSIVLLVLSFLLLCAGLLASPSSQVRSGSLPSTSKNSPSLPYPKHLQHALTFAGTLEQGNNRGAVMDMVNRFCRVPLGSSYCASWVSWILADSHVTTPHVRSASSRAFVLRTSYTINDVLWGRYKPQPGDLILWKRRDGGHIGFIIDWRKDQGHTIEANTSNGLHGSQWNGGGIWKRSRSYEPFNSIFSITHVTPVR